MDTLTFTIDGAVEATGLARTRIYELLGKGDLQGVKAGRRTLVTRASIERYLATLPPAEIRAPKAA